LSPVEVVVVPIAVVEVEEVEFCKEPPQYRELHSK
jgi:hypothetical protein